MKHSTLPLLSPNRFKKKTKRHALRLNTQLTLLDPTYTQASMQIKTTNDVKFIYSSF